MATYTDSFTYTQNQDLDGLGNWVKVIGRFTTKGGTRVCVDDFVNAGESCYRYNASLGNDQYSQAVIVARDTSGYHCYGVAARISTSATTYYAFYADDNGGCYLIKSVNGTVTELDNATYTTTVNDVLRIECNGTSIVGKVNGVTKVSATDSSITSGQAGLAGYLSDDITGLDDWEGGDLGSSQVFGFKVGYIKVS